MINKLYQKQVRLLLKTLPEVARETHFALHGGTAINLFIRDMPRLSVDIDLTYIHFEDRPQSILKINKGLNNIKNQIEAVVPGVKIQHKKDIAKLLVSSENTLIKVEVNLVNRGVLEKPFRLPLCKRAETEYDAFAAIQVLSIGQLYGGKICAALDRQHPRDLFDIKYLFDNEGFSKEVKTGFLLALAGSDRPMHELLNPNLLDQRPAISNQFSGMSYEAFTYNDFEQTRKKLISVVNNELSSEDKEFLLSIKNLSPDWDIYNFQKFPSIQWKIQNIEKLKLKNPDKYREQLDLLKRQLEIT